jgi:hypothetical protein
MRFSVQCLVVGLWMLDIAPVLSGTPAPGTSATPSKVDIQKLYVSVIAPATIENVLKSGLLKRLRQFNDVEIEEEIESADQAFFVKAMELRLLGGDSTGYAISVVSTDRKSLRFFLNRLTEESDKFFAEEYRDATLFGGELLYSCSQTQLDKILDGIVADIDSDTLEPMRQTHQRVNKQREEENRRPKKSSDEE